MVQFQQSIFLCLLFSCMAGLSSNCSKFVVLFQHKRQQEGKAMFKHGRRIALFSGMMFQLLNNVFMVLASWFGPVSIYWPTNVSTQLLTNTIFVGVILRTEPISKNMQVAVVVMSISVIYLPIIGPGITEDQDLYDLTLGNPFAMAWLGLLALVHYGCALTMFTRNLQDKHPFGQTVLLGVGVTSAVLGGTVSKAASLVEGLPRTLLMCMFASISGNGLCEALLQATVVPSMAIYVPLFTFFSLMLNAVNGVIVWEDWKVIESWVGYILTLILTGAGIYLMTDLDFFQKQAKELKEIKQDLLSDYVENMPTFLLFGGGYNGRNTTNMTEDEAVAMGFSRHQIVINQHTRGLKRGNSDPELNVSRSVSKSFSDFDDDDLDDGHSMGADSFGIDVVSIDFSRRGSRDGTNRSVISNQSASIIRRRYGSRTSTGTISSGSIGGFTNGSRNVGFSNRNASRHRSDVSFADTLSSFGSDLDPDEEQLPLVDAPNGATPNVVMVENQKRYVRPKRYGKRDSSGSMGSSLSFSAEAPPVTEVTTGPHESSLKNRSAKASSDAKNGSNGSKNGSKPSTNPSVSMEEMYLELRAQAARTTVNPPTSPLPSMQSSSKRKNQNQNVPTLTDAIAAAPLTDEASNSRHSSKQGSSKSSKGGSKKNQAAVADSNNDRTNLVDTTGNDASSNFEAADGQFVDIEAPRGSVFSQEGMSQLERDSEEITIEFSASDDSDSSWNSEEDNSEGMILWA